MTSRTKSFLSRLNRRDIPLLPKIPKFFKIALISIILLSTVFFVRHQITKAQESQESTVSGILTDEQIQNHPIKKKQQAIKEGNNQESWIDESISSNAASALTAVIGEVPDDVLAGKETAWVPNGLMGQSLTYISYLYNSPIASGTLYLADRFNNFIGKPAYAQSNGIGFEGLQPLLPIWKVFRNIVYVLISLFFIFVGLMVMLRVKINPQTVITIQSTIPRLISTLILVTFSYAIAGLLIDLSYVLPALIISLLSKVILPTGTITIPEQLYDLNNYQAFIMAQYLVNSGQVFWLCIVLGVALTPAMALSAVVGLIAGILAPLILAIMIIVWLIKFFFGLLKCYFNIILKIILAPFEIGVGAIPNMKIGFSSWIVGLIANLAVFPVVTIYLLTVFLIIYSITDRGIWVPNILALSSNSRTLIKCVLGLGALMLLPKLPKLIPEAVFQIKPSPFGQAIGESAAPLGNFAKSTGNIAKSNFIDNTGGKWFGKMKTNRIVSQANKPAAGEGNPAAGGVPGRQPDVPVVETPSRNQ